MVYNFVKPQPIKKNSLLESAWKVLPAYEIQGKSEMVGWLAGTVDMEWPFIQTYTHL